MELYAQSAEYFYGNCLHIDPRFAGRLDAPEIQALLKEFAALDRPAPGAATDAKSVAVLAFAAPF